MKRIVIIGGGFAGAYCAKKLESKFDVTLIDSKDYYEFTPGVLRTIVEPKHLKKIQVLHRHYLKRAKIVNGCVNDITSKEVIFDNKKIVYDYLVVAAGSRYNKPIKEMNIIAEKRGNELRDYYERVCKAKSIIIIGGGIVGVELTAELITHYKDKEIILVHDKNILMERMNKKTQEYAKKFFINHRVKLVLGERIVKSNKNEFITDKGTKIKAELAFLCTGIIPNSDLLKKCFKDKINEKGQIVVNKYLQVKDFNNIFSAGDINNILDEKTAQNAEKQAHVVIENIKNLEKNKSLKEYTLLPRIMVISLGKFNGVITYKNFALTGLIAGFLKWFVEFKTMMRYK